MDSPQVENGYTKIANEIVDKLCKIRIPGEAMQILFFIIRKTYGWNKKSDCISHSQFVKGTGIIRQHISRSLEKLEKMNLIVVTNKGYRNGAEYRFNKDYRKWKSVPKKVTVTNNGTTVTNNGSNLVPKKVRTKDTIQKTLYKRNTFPSFSDGKILYSLSVNNGEYSYEYKDEADIEKLEQHDRTISLMRYIDDRTVRVRKIKRQLSYVEANKLLLKYAKYDNDYLKSKIDAMENRKKLDYTWLYNTLNNWCKNGN